jgi:hypothetical protein
MWSSLLLNIKPIFYGYPCVVGVGVAVGTIVAFVGDSVRLGLGVDHVGVVLGTGVIVGVFVIKAEAVAWCAAVNCASRVRTWSVKGDGIRILSTASSNNILTSFSLGRKTWA